MKGERSALGAFVLGAVVGAAIAIPIVLAFSQGDPILGTAGGAPSGDSKPRELSRPAGTLEGQGRTEKPAVPKEAAARRERVETGPRPPSPSFGVVVYGTVTAKDGSPVEDARISFLSPDNDRDKNRYTSFQKGGYTAHGLTPGEWKVSLRGEGLKTTTRVVTVLPQESQRLDLVAERSFTVLVKINTPSGKPLPDVMEKAKIYRPVDRLVAVATTSAPSGNLPMTFSRSLPDFGIGRWRGTRGMARLRGPSKLPVDVVGELEFDVPPPVFVSVVMRHVVLATKHVLPGQKEVTFEISLEDVRKTFTTVRVQVVDAETMAPIAKAHVGLSDQQTGSGGVPTDENGCVVLKDRAPGLFQLGISAKDHARYSQNIRLAPGEHDLGTIGLSRPIKVRGRVVDRAGKTHAARVQWTLLDRRTFPQPLRRNRSTSAKSDGKFEIWNCAPGRYLVQALVRGESAGNKEIDTTRLGDKPFDIVVDPVVKVAIDSTMMSKTRIPLVTIRDANNLPVYSRYIRGQFNYPAELPVGNYTYEVHDDLQLADSGALVVAAGGKPRIVVR
jgi:Carboxypeptidase regulatory-like domain